MPAPDFPEQAPRVGPGFGRIYQAPAPIIPPRDKPIYISVLRPGPGSLTIPLGEASPHLLAVERRVGRGRITMLTLNPIEPVMMAWPGLDTMVRRVDPPPARGGPSWARPPSTATPIKARRAAGSVGADLTWYRITSRDARPQEDAAGRLPKAPQARELPKTSRARAACPAPRRIPPSRPRSPRSGSPIGTT